MKRPQEGLIARVLPHLTLVIALLMLVLFAIDRFNNNMAFLTSEISKWLMGLLALLAFCTSLYTILRRWRAEDAAAAQREQALQQAKAHAAAKAAADAERKASASAWPQD